MMSDTIKFAETPLVDESIEEYEYHEYEHITGTNLNHRAVKSELLLNRKTCSHILERVTSGEIQNETM